MRRGRGLLLALACSFAAALPSYAQTASAVAPKETVAAQQVDVVALQQRRSMLFQRMLERPDDLDSAFEYAALSVQAGDLEAAVSTLERMLIFAPGLPRLQLELGVLYYRLAAYETARSYFEAAVAGPNVPDEVRGRVEQYLGGIDIAGRTTRFSGQVRAGIRYQTNANRAPLDSTIILNGLPFTLDPGSLGSSDGNVYAAGVFHLSHNLASQGDTLEVDLVTYASKQFEREELDVALAELTVGPAFNLGRFGIENGALGVYGIVSGVVVDGYAYSGAVGAGTRLVLRPTPRLSTTAAFEYRHREYDNSPAAPTADNRDGYELRLLGNAAYIFSPTLTLTGSGYIQRTEAQRGFLTYTEGGATASLAVSFASPFGVGSAPWIVSPTAGFVVRRYDDPDPVISPTTVERDTEAFVGANLVVPMRDNWALLAETEYRNVSSNYPTRDYDNFSVSLSLVKGF